MQSDLQKSVDCRGYLGHETGDSVPVCRVRVDRLYCRTETGGTADDVIDRECHQGMRYNDDRPYLRDRPRPWAVYDYVIA